MYCSVQQKRKVTDRRFGDLMELYEQNYVQLRLLVPDLKTSTTTTRLSRVPGCLPLYLQVVEKSPYTTTLRLTYRFLLPPETKPATGKAIGRARSLLEPDLLLRVYHDARTAEVVSGLIHGQQHVTRLTRGLEKSWKLNRFLYKWLRYLQLRGHQFGPQSESDADFSLDSVRKEALPSGSKKSTLKVPVPE